MTEKIKICILGGGFGGLYTALYLAKSKAVISGQWEITLVEPKDNFLFTPLLYEILTDELKRWEIAPTYQKLLLGSNIKWIRDRVAKLSLEIKEVLLENKTILNYDYLVLAVGRKTRFFPIPGLQENALTFRTIVDAELLKNRLHNIKNAGKNKPNITVIGAGANGVELACKVYDYLRLDAKNDRTKINPQINIIDKGTDILTGFGSGIKKAANKALKRRHIDVLLSTNILEIKEDSMTLQQENTINYPVDLVFWTAGTETHNWVANLACQSNKFGQLLTIPSLQLIDYPEVLALGDVADIRNNKVTPVPTTAQAAYQQASTAAKNLQAIIQNKPLKKFYYLHLGDMLTLGKGEAIISSFGVNISGKLAGLIRRLIYIQRLPTMKHRLRVFKNLLFGGIAK